MDTNLKGKMMANNDHAAAMRYEEVAQYLLNRISETFGVGRFEGKQSLIGESGTTWEIDAKGCSDGSDRVVVVECKRHTKSGIPQAITGALAYTIRDVGAVGGVLVSPMGLQAGAAKVANHNGIVEVILREDSTTSDYLMRFLNQIHVGNVCTVRATESLTMVVRDINGVIIERREI